MPRLFLASEFLSACATPVAAPSANLSGRPSPTTWESVAEDLDGRVDCILQGAPTEVGLESTVVDCSGEVPLILRSGSVTFEQLREVLPSVSSGGEGPNLNRSPGMHHRHYKPSAKVVVIQHPDIIERTPGTAYIGRASSVTPFDHQLVCRDVEEYARQLYEFLRECDRRGIHTINCQEVAEIDLGVALMDRLRRAAG
jgi:L-threonylcarbamoyladenylate synthase